MAYTGLHVAMGPADVEEAVPSSAFSRGDLLVYDSTSSISRAPVSNLSAIDLAGVAMADSTQSFNDLVPYVRAENRTTYFSVLTGALTSVLTKGQVGSFIEDADGRPVFETGSDNDPAAVIERNFEDIEQDSGVSRIVIRLLAQPVGGGGLEHDN